MIISRRQQFYQLTHLQLNSTRKQTKNTVLYCALQDVSNSNSKIFFSSFIPHSLIDRELLITNTTCYCQRTRQAEKNEKLKRYRFSRKTYLFQNVQNPLLLSSHQLLKISFSHSASKTEYRMLTAHLDSISNSHNL